MQLSFIKNQNVVKGSLEPITNWYALYSAAGPAFINKYNKIVDYSTNYSGKGPISQHYPSTYTVGQDRMVFIEESLCSAEWH